MISTTTNRVAYNGDGTSAVFAFQYEFHNQSDLDVYVWNSNRAPYVQTLVLNVGYVISGTADAQGRYTNGASVVFNSTPAQGDVIVINRDIGLTQPFNLIFGQTIPNQELMKSLDRLALMEQTINDMASRSIRMNVAYPFAFDPTMPPRLVPGAPLIVNSSGLGLEFGVATNSGVSYFGILPVNNGGTGLDMSTLKGVVYSPGNNTTFERILNGNPGEFLTSTGTSAPTFQAFSAANVNSGTVAVAYGGTGRNDLTTNGVAVGSGTTQMAYVGPGGGDVPLVGNAGEQPSFRALNLASGSSVVNILPQSKGGTGTASSFPQYAVIYQSGAGQYGHIPSADEGKVLRSHGSSAPSFDSVAALSNKTTANVTHSDSPYSVASVNTIVYVNASTSNVVVRLADLSNIGGSVKVKRVDSTAGTIVTVVGSGSFSVDGSSYVLYAQGEIGEFTLNTSRWEVTDRQAPITDAEFWGSDPSGHGTVLTSTRRGYTIRKNTLSPFATFTDGTTSGVAITVLIPGIYSASITDGQSASSEFVGITVNATSAATIQTLSYANGFRADTLVGTNARSRCTYTAYMNAGDIIRPQTDGQANETGEGVSFDIKYLGRF